MGMTIKQAYRIFDEVMAHAQIDNKGAKRVRATWQHSPEGSAAKWVFNELASENPDPYLLEVVNSLVLKDLE